MRDSTRTGKHDASTSNDTTSDLRLVVVILVVVALALAVFGLVLGHVESEQSAMTSAQTAQQQTPQNKTTGKKVSNSTATDSATADSSTSSLVTLAQQHSEALSAAATSAQVRSAIEQVISSYGDNVSVTYIPFADTNASVSINGSTQRLSASMIKMLILACLLDEVSSGQVDLSAQLSVQANELADGTGDIQEAGVGATYTVYEVAQSMISNSDNTAANMLIDLLGFDAINDEATKLGLTHTRLANKLSTGEILNEGRNVTSSDDMARLFVAIATAQVGDEQLCSEALGFLVQQNLTGGIPLGVPDGITCAHKTGSVDSVQNDGAIVYASYPYVLVVLTDGLDDGIDAAAQISQAVYAATNG